jgi:hypothetical protein
MSILKMGDGSTSTAAVAPDIKTIRERVRSRIAFGLVGLLVVVVSLGVLGLLIGRLSPGDLKELFFSLGLLTTLVQGIIKYYFGQMKK